MNQELIVWLSEGLLLLFIIVASALIAASNIYDIRLKIRSKDIQKVQSKFHGDRQPFITVLVYAQNSSSFIDKCLDDIRKNRYSRHDVVVVDNSSSDDTRRKVRLFKQKYPQLPIRLYSQRKHGDRSEILRQGYRRSQKGDLVLVIDASSVIPPKFLKSSAARFVSDGKLNILNFNVHGTSLHSITLMYYRFLQLSKSLFNKSLSLTSKYPVKTLQSGSMYRRNIFRDACRLPAMAGQYDSGLHITDYSINNDKAAISYLVPGSKSVPFGALRFLVILSAISLQAYSIYIAATLQSRTLLIVGWLAVVVWVLLATWSAEATKISDKIRLTFCAPIVYFMLYAQLIMIVIIVATKTVLLFGQLTHSFVRYVVYR